MSEQKNENGQIIDIDTEKDQSFSEVEELKNKLEQEKDTRLRLLAEFDNYRKRIEKEKNDLVETIRHSVIKDFLPILDNLEKAYETALDTNCDIALKEGIELVIKSFKQMLEKYEIKEIDTTCEFNPNVHEALMIVEHTENGKIMQVFEKGYSYKDKLIRPAKVSVGQKIDTNENNEEV